MKEYRWPLTLADVHDHLNEWPGGDASGLVIWALLASEGLAYLVDIDAELRSGTKPPPSWSWQAVDVSHARWAAVSAITILDLAAGALGRLHLPPKRDQSEYALSDFFDEKRGQERRQALPRVGRRWVEQTRNDSSYQTVRRARNPFTHGKLRTSVVVTLGSPHSSRSSFHVGPNEEPVGSRDLIEMAFGVVDRRMGAFLSEVKRGTLWKREGGLSLAEPCHALAMPCSTGTGPLFDWTLGSDPMGPSLT